MGSQGNCTATHISQLLRFLFICSKGRNWHYFVIKPTCTNLGYTEHLFAISSIIYTRKKNQIMVSFIAFLWLWGVFTYIPESCYFVSRYYHLRHCTTALEKLTWKLPLLFSRRNRFLCLFEGIPGSQIYLGF